MTWDDDRDFVDDFVDGLTSGLTSGITAPTTATKAAPVVSAGLSSALASTASMLKPAPSVAAVPTPAPTSMSSMVLHTPVITTPLQKALGPAASSGAAQALQSAAAKVGGTDIVISTPGAAPHVETLPVASDLDARLRAIRGALLAIRAQSEATSEHHSLINRDSFRKNVIARLSRIESRLPSGSAAAEQIRTIRVLL